MRVRGGVGVGPAELGRRDVAAVMRRQALLRAARRREHVAAGRVAVAPVGHRQRLLLAALQAVAAALGRHVCEGVCLGRGRRAVDGLVVRRRGRANGRRRGHGRHGRDRRRVRRLHHGADGAAAARHVAADAVVALGRGGRVLGEGGRRHVAGDLVRGRECRWRRNRGHVHAKVGVGGRAGRRHVQLHVGV